MRECYLQPCPNHQSKSKPTQWSFDNKKGTREVEFDGIKDCDLSFSSVESFGRDITGELVSAARRGGVEPGLYFSHIDWFDADMRIDQWNPAGTNLCKGQPCDPGMYNKSSLGKEWERFVIVSGFLLPKPPMKV